MSYIHNIQYTIHSIYMYIVDSTYGINIHKTKCPKTGIPPFTTMSYYHNQYYAKVLTVS